MRRPVVQDLLIISQAEQLMLSQANLSVKKEPVVPLSAAY